MCLHLTCVKANMYIFRKFDPSANALDESLHSFNQQPLHWAVQAKWTMKKSKEAKSVRKASSKKKAESLVKLNKKYKTDKRLAKD